MAISERAQQDHDELFPGHVSTLKVKRSRTDRVLRQLCVRRGAASREPGHQDTAHGAAGIHDRLPGAQGVMLGAALTVDVTPVEVKEIVYHAVPYVGMYKVFDFIHATNDVLTERGVELPLPGQSTTTPEDRMEKGLRSRRRSSVPRQSKAMYAAAPEDEMHIQHYLSGNCFGDHFTRTGSDLRTRELLNSRCWFRSAAASLK
jgi:4-carboxymuconolactone decarboxylase